MKQITTLFVVSLLLTCMYMPCIAAAGNNDGLRAYDAQVNKTIGQARAANVSNGSAGLGMAATAQAIKGASGNGLNVDSSGLYRARDAYRNDRTPENRQMLMDAAKDHLLQMLDLMIGRLELLQEQIEFTEENSIIMPKGASENIDRYILRLESYKPEVESADTEADLRSVARSINQEWGSIRKEILHYAKYMVAARTEAYIAKADDISDRLEAKIIELDGEGVDTTNLRLNLDDFNAKLVCVEENYELAKAAVSDDEINSGEVQQYIRNASRCIGEANNILREMFKELRALEGYRDGAVMLNGTGTLKASGSGTAWIHGSLDLALSCDHGALTVHDHIGDMNITVTGNGAEDQTGRWTIYRGFDGTADITGSDVSVALVGSGIDLTVAGTGRAILVGDGTYQVRGSDDGLISSGDWQEQRDGYEIGIEAIVSEEAEYAADESADEAEDEAAADETVNESADDPANGSDSGADEVGDGDADASGNETESGTDDSGVES
ncbi:MAG: hypothetical protein C5617_004990 [ANME-2 cluster archaeon]|jgi:hypothetical protein|nr:MAG: hypothetical protein C5617_004990 [ANME-2 cluster archaeon]